MERVQLGGRKRGFSDLIGESSPAGSQPPGVGWKQGDIMLALHAHCSPQTNSLYSTSKFVRPLNCPLRPV